ncbi:hypothetical protein [Egicoccus halophilus]|uniref:Uncharacterized protein n=1 Tax=Egicoccus halophilus TaxID=1670830 RepID=A0A8J3AGX7_9ACTN|nr:hypothetical protein [Egicoccus halophilus]GGI08815.1 hypothetical protein GCM10011354_30970 [Egicoccus halophilus]
MSDPPTSPFDRVRKPDPTVPRVRDGQGKEALYSTAPTAAPPPQIEVTCRSCGVLRGVSLLEALRLLRPPSLWLPFRSRIFSRCPTCGRRAWLHVELGQALRVLRSQLPGS